MNTVNRSFICFFLLCGMTTTPVIASEPKGMQLFARSNVDNNIIERAPTDIMPALKKRKIDTICFDSVFQATQSLTTGQVWFMFIKMISTQYYVSIEADVRNRPGYLPLSFSIHRAPLELHASLDRLFDKIAPDEMGELNSYQKFVFSSPLLHLVTTSLIAGLVILLVAFMGSICLRKLMSQGEQDECARSEQMALLRAMLDGTPHPIYVLDREGRLLICNSHYLKTMGVELDHVFNKTIIESAYAEAAQGRTHLQALHDEYLTVMSNDTPHIQDRNLHTIDGKLMTVYQWLLPFKNSDGVVVGLVAGWIDISERQRLLEELQSAKKSSDDASRAKSVFLATMSHEIRTPMNAVIGMLELALKKANHGIVDRFAIEVASGAARELMGLIGDILDIARIESGRLSLVPERANVRELVETVVRVFEGVARQKSLQLNLSFDLNCANDVLIDPMRFKQVLSNLLSNAIKFTHVGEVRLDIKALDSLKDDHLSLWISITDTGIGISEEDQARLFNPFEQASNHNQSFRGGSGLGLVISRTLCEMMHGQLQLSSQPGKGTRVEIMLDLLALPDLPVIEEVIRPELLPKGRPLKILVVDDYPANRLLLSQQLGYLGHQVRNAEDGAHGLRDWRKEPFDVIITDCNMPIMSGYDLARAVREEERTQNASPCLILGFTANALVEEKQRCIDAGMDDCLFKPISIMELSQRLDQVQTDLVEVQIFPPPIIDVGRIDEDINLTTLEQLTQGDQAAIQGLLRDLASSNEEDMYRLTRLFTSHDLQGLSDLAHRVKGGARIINAKHLIRSCEQVEEACAGFDSVQLLNTVEALQLAMEQLASLLEPLIR